MCLEHVAAYGNVSKVTVRVTADNDSVLLSCDSGNAGTGKQNVKANGIRRAIMAEVNECNSGLRRTTMP